MKSLLLLTCFLFSNLIFAQKTGVLIGTFQLEKISYKNISANKEASQEEFYKVLRTASYQNLSAKQRSDDYELEQLAEQLIELLKKHYHSTIQLMNNGALINQSELMNLPLSGEYLSDKKKILIDWETGDRTHFKIIKSKDDKLVLKDNSSKVIFHYSKMSQREIDEKNERSKRAKEAEWPKPDKERIEAEKKAQDEFRNE